MEPGVKWADDDFYEIALRGRNAAGDRLLTVEFMTKAAAPSRFSDRYIVEAPHF